MSRDWTPQELDYVTQQHPELVEGVQKMTITLGDKTMPLYNDEELDLMHRYPKLGKFGFDMLNICKQNGVYSSEQGKQLLQIIEDYFNGVENETYKEVCMNAQKWYEGTFCPGYYMNDNNHEFADYLKSQISMRILD